LTVAISSKEVKLTKPVEQDGIQKDQNQEAYMAIDAQTQERPTMISGEGSTILVWVVVVGLVFYLLWWLVVSRPAEPLAQKVAK
jgi:hypothetical protein